MFPSASAPSRTKRSPARRRCGASGSTPSERAMRSAIVKPMPGSSMRRYGSCRRTSTTSSPNMRTSRTARPALMPCVNRNVSTSRTVATSRHASIARSMLFREIARPLRVRTSRSRSGFASSSAKTSAAPKWATIARANTGPMPGTRAVSQRTTPCSERGRAERKVSTSNCVPYRACSENSPAHTSWSPAPTWPRGPVSVTGSASLSSPSMADQTANSKSGETYRGPDAERVTSISIRRPRSGVRRRAPRASPAPSPGTPRPGGRPARRASSRRSSARRRRGRRP